MFLEKMMQEQDRIILGGSVSRCDASWGKEMLWKV